MLKPIATTILVALVALAGCQSRTASPTADTAGRTGPLFEKIRGLDTAVFDAFNTCQIAGNLEKHGAFFAEDVEFYHDEGGVTWNRQDMLANTRQFVCGHYTRELMPGSLRVYPVKDFGAIEQGAHRFCQSDTGNCDGAADFVIVWRQRGDEWTITRVLSYGHHPI